MQSPVPALTTSALKYPQLLTLHAPVAVRKISILSDNVGQQPGASEPGVFPWLHFGNSAAGSESVQRALTTKNTWKSRFERILHPPRARRGSRSSPAPPNDESTTVSPLSDASLMQMSSPAILSTGPTSFDMLANLTKHSSGLVTADECLDSPIPENVTQESWFHTLPIRQAKENNDNMAVSRYRLSLLLHLKVFGDRRNLRLDSLRRSWAICREKIKPKVKY